MDTFFCYLMVSNNREVARLTTECNRLISLPDRSPAALRKMRMTGRSLEHALLAGGRIIQIQKLWNAANPKILDIEL